jgi:hypothetical protein
VGSTDLLGDISDGLACTKLGAQGVHSGGGEKEYTNRGCTEETHFEQLVCGVILHTRRLGIYKICREASCLIYDGQQLRPASGFRANRQARIVTIHPGDVSFHTGLASGHHPRL